MIFIDLDRLHNVPDLVAAMIRCAITDALGENEAHAAQARWWLELAGMSHLLQRPESAQFHPDARRRKPRKPSAAASAVSIGA